MSRFVGNYSFLSKKRALKAFSSMQLPKFWENITEHGNWETRAIREQTITGVPKFCRKKYEAFVRLEQSKNLIEMHETSIKILIFNIYNEIFTVLHVFNHTSFNNSLFGKKKFDESLRF